MSEIISTVDFLVEEEAQVVPSSLDHLSRHELCHMIYRLDYERHTLKEKLVALRHAFSAVNNNNNQNNNVSLGGGPPGGGGVKRRRTRQLPPQLPNKRKSESTSSQQNKNTQQQQQPEEEKKTAVATPSTKRQKKSNQNDNKSAATTKTTSSTQPIKSITPSEMDAIHKRLTEKVTSQIKSSIHGGLRRPRTVAEETGIALSTAMYIMEKWKRKLTQDTNRIVKWEFKSSSSTTSSSSSSVDDNSKNSIHINTEDDDDDDISKFLLCEKYLSGVRHNGKGFLSIGRNNHNNNGGGTGGGGGGSSNGGGFLLKHAKFESMIVSYNKSVQALKIQVSTRGCNEYGKC
jgi:hypothetical protein